MSAMDYKDLDVYKTARELIVYVYEHTKVWPREEIYGLTSQVRRAAVSILSNFAEGSGRLTSKDKIHFFIMARGSAFEVEAQLDVAHVLGYISSDTFNDANTKIQRVKMLLNGVIRKIENINS